MSARLPLEKTTPFVMGELAFHAHTTGVDLETHPIAILVRDESNKVTDIRFVSYMSQTTHFAKFAPNSNAVKVARRVSFPIHTKQPVFPPRPRRHGG